MARGIIVYRASAPEAPAAYGTNAERIEAILDGRTPHFSLNTPTDPTITTEATVNASTAAASLAVDGRRTILTADTYGTLTLSGDDMEVVISAGCSIDLIRFQGVRIRVQAPLGSARTHTIRRVESSPFGTAATSRTDYMLDGLFIESGAGTATNETNQFTMRRVAILNTYINSAGFGAWFPGVPAGGVEEQDVFLGNSYMESTRAASDQGGQTEATFRMSSGFQRVVVVDSRLLNDNAGAGASRQHFRLHSNNVASAGAWIDNVDFIGTNAQLRPTTSPGGAAPDPEAMSSIRFNDTRWWPYLSAGQACPISGVGTANDPLPTDVEITNSTLYTDGGNTFNTGGGAWTLSGNSVEAHSEPPAWSWPS